MMHRQLFETHTRAKLHTNFSLKAKSHGDFSSEALISVKVSVCALAPSKVVVLALLYRILEELASEEDGHLLGNEKQQFDSEWVWNLVETVSKACSHKDQVHDEEQDPDMQLRLVLDCYTE